MAMATDLSGRVVVVTGASSGFGAALARRLSALGARLVLAARRMDRLEALRTELGRPESDLRVYPVDVADAASTAKFVESALADFGGIDVLINNAGLARGFSRFVDNDEQDWREMIEANVMGLMRVTRAFLPCLLARGLGDIVHVGSVAGVQPYANGAAYCASKAAVEAFAQALRLELAGTGIRQLVIEPGMAETEFSEVRFHGDRERAKKVYEGMMPLSADDVAECIVFALTRPAHVSLQTLLLMPTAQARVDVVSRRP
ncbi:MAG TPA: SDR family NAD(P)-dependent oxidoreductase [Polyangiaceae bacterium]